MAINVLTDVGFGEELPVVEPDTSLAASGKFAELIGWSDGKPGRFSDHDAARKEGLPSAMCPGVMSQGMLAAMIHNWAPNATIRSIDTVFRAPVQADVKHTIKGVVTDIDEDEGLVEIDLTVINDKDETRVFGTASVFVPKA